MENIVIDDVTKTPLHERDLEDVWYKEGDIFTVDNWNDFCWQDVKTNKLIFKAHAHIITQQEPNTYSKDEILEIINSIPTKINIRNEMACYGYAIIDADTFKEELIKKFKL